MHTHTPIQNRASVHTLCHTQTSTYANISCLFAQVSGTLLTCRQNTFSLPRRGWMQALEESLGQEKDGGHMRS